MCIYYIYMYICTYAHKTRRYAWVQGLTPLFDRYFGNVLSNVLRTPTRFNQDQAAKSQ